MKSLVCFSYYHFETIAKTASILAAYTTAGVTRPAGLQDQTAEETKSPYKWSTQRASAIDYGNNNVRRWYPCQKKCSGKDNKSSSLEVIEIYLFFLIVCFFRKKKIYLLCSCKKPMFNELCKMNALICGNWRAILKK